jgi:D-3-phosphoglycerate dehydrogenase
MILLPDPIAEPGMRLLEAHGQVVLADPATGDYDDAILARAEGILLRLSKADRAFLDRTPQLKVIARHGVGVDTVDVDEATRRGIAVVITPTANYNAVAEHALHLMLCVSRKAVLADNIVRRGDFSARLDLMGFELRGKTLGLVGLGRVGVRLAEICAAAFGMTVLVFDPYVDAQRYNGPAKLCASLDDLLPQADILSLHAPATEATRNMINAERIAAMKPGAVLVNTARGVLVDEPALADALTRGHLAGAGLDVFVEEPPAADSPIANAPNTVFSPHVASSTREAINQMAEESAQGLVDVLEGKRPAGIYNPAIYDH